MHLRAYVNVRIIIGLVGGAAGLVAACGGDDPGTLRSTCFDMSAPGTVVLAPSIDVSLRDHNGHGLALGSAVAVTGTGGVTPFEEQDTVHAFVAATPGTFTLHVSRPFYRDTTVSNVTVAADACGRAVPTKINLTLELLPNAPAFRSVNIVGGFFLGEPGAKDTLRAYFDAEPQVSRAVSWRISDTTIASLTPEGIVTDKCTLDGGTETATVLPAADTTRQTSVRFSVAPRTFCP
jgi:hypothetical protein